MNIQNYPKTIQKIANECKNDDTISKEYEKAEEASDKENNYVCKYHTKNKAIQNHITQ